MQYRYSFPSHIDLAWDQASSLGEKGETKTAWWKKKSERSEPKGSLGRGKGGGAWRYAFDATDATDILEFKMK